MNLSPQGARDKAEIVANGSRTSRLLLTLLDDVNRQLQTIESLSTVMDYLAQVRASIQGICSADDMSGVTLSSRANNVLTEISTPFIATLAAAEKKKEHHQKEAS